MATRVEPRFKAADIWEVPEDGFRYEVIDGALYMNPAPNVAHQYASGALFGILFQHVHANNLGVLLAAPTGVVLDDESAVQPDLVFLSSARRFLLSERGIEGAPDLVVEILSPRTEALDRGVKMRRYARGRIAECWLVDPRVHRLEAYRLVGEGYELAASVGPGDVFRPTGFPGLEIPLDALFLV